MAVIGTPIRGLLSTLRDLRDYGSFKRSSGSHRFRGVYGSYQTARAALPAGRLQGFDHDSVADFFAATHMVFNPSDYPILYWLSKLLKPACALFDVGGGIGQSFYLYQERSLQIPAQMRWMIYEVEALARRGRSVAAARGEDRLEFTSELSDLGGADILLTTGALQYVEQDLPTLLREGAALPEHVLINRVPMYSGQTYFTIQHAQHSFAPYRISNVGEFLAEMKTLGYECADQWYLPRSLRVPFHPSYAVPHYYGFYFRLRSASEGLQPRVLRSA